MIAAKGRGFEIADPPRRVGVRAQLGVVFGSLMVQVACGLLCFSLLFVAIFAMNSEALTRVEFMASTAQGEGEVLEVRETSSSENERVIMSVRFAYQVEGSSYEGTSYALNAPFDPGDKVRVEHVVNRPESARIVGMRARTFSSLAAFVFLFPFAGIALLVGALRSGLRTRRLLRDGRLGYGRLVEKEATSGSVNEQRIYKLTFEFVLPRAEVFGNHQDKWSQWAETHRFHHKTHKTEKLEDEALEPLLFDPRKPGNAVLVDALPGNVHFSGPSVSGGSVLALMLPMLTALLYSLFFATLLV